MRTFTRGFRQSYLYDTFPFLLNQMFRKYIHLWKANFSKKNYELANLALELFYSKNKHCAIAGVYYEVSTLQIAHLKSLAKLV